MTWRVIPLHTETAAMNMAIDEAVSESARGGQPTIRFWTWSPGAVSIGYFQSMKDEVNLEKCKELGIDIVRRRTGGGAVYHDSKRELTYSVIAPSSMFPQDLTACYKEICGWLVKGFANLGIQSEFKPINDIIVSGKKISGNAATIRSDVLLQHGTILHDLDVREMFSLLKVSKEKISDKAIATVEERVTRILDHKPGLTIQQSYQAFLRAFTEGKDFEIAGLTEGELKRAKALAENKYSKDEWNFWR